ncbi:MAG: hypothetical protein ABEI58_00890 [Candidatus Nanohaloarchaea archaeon]
MNLEQDYIEYVAEFSLSILAVSAAYFLEPFQPVTYLTLLLIPLLFGYTAYISKESFRTSAFLSFIALFFAPINYIMAGVAVLLSLGNVFVSFFAGGDHFHDFYSATTIPLLLIGLILGSATFYAASTQPGVAEDIRSTAGKFVGNYAEEAVDDSNIMESQKQAQVQVIEQTSRATITFTQAYVINQTKNDLTSSEQAALLSAFGSAQQEIPAELAANAEKRFNSTGVDISERTSDLLESNFKGRMLIILIPMITFGVYSLQPIIGLLTALAASLFAWTEQRLA